MKRPFTSLSEQVAEILREGIHAGRWTKTIPGRIRLAAELGVNHKTVKAALALLERDGMLEPGEPGRERRITDGARTAKAALRVKLLAYDSSDMSTFIYMEMLHRLQQAGHMAGFATKTMTGLGLDTQRVARYVRGNDADAWVVMSGTKEVLEWFAEYEKPAFALFGRMLNVPMAGTAPVKRDALHELVDRLVAYGHRRIVMISHEERRKPVPGQFERLFISRLESHGIRTGAYNLPDWGNSPEDLAKSIRTLFLHTPPTAVLVDDSHLFLAVTQHLARLGIAAPQQVSLACTDDHPTFGWCSPAVTHIAWNTVPVINRVVNWVDHTSRGKQDKRATFTRAKLVPGGTIGPVPGRKV